MKLSPIIQIMNISVTPKVSLCLFIIPSAQQPLSPSNNPFVFCHCRFFAFLFDFIQM